MTGKVTLEVVLFLPVIFLLFKVVFCCTDFGKICPNFCFFLYFFLPQCQKLSILRIFFWNIESEFLFLVTTLSFYCHVFFRRVRKKKFFFSIGTLSFFVFYFPIFIRASALKTNEFKPHPYLHYKTLTYFNSNLSR